MDPLGRQSVASPADVERQLAEFWRAASTDAQAVMRACSMNLVVVCADAPEELRRVTECVARIAETVPGRALVVAPPRDDLIELEVYVSAHCHRGADGAQVCSEQITIEPPADAFDLVPATVLQLLVEDLPVHTWWRRTGPGGGAAPDSLVALSDEWIVDSASANDAAEQLSTLLGLASRARFRGHVKDAAWARLESWREAVASFFDDPLLRPALHAIRRVEVTAGGSVPHAYLAGWLLARLGFGIHSGEYWSREDGGKLELSHTSGPDLAPGAIGAVKLTCASAGGTVSFEASRAADRGSVVLQVVSAERRLPARTIELPELDEAALICGVIQQTGSDALFEEALTRATRVL